MDLKYKYFWNNKYYIPPTYVELDDYDHLGDKTYTNSYYLKPGLASKLRTRHFDICLKLTRSYFHKSNVIDFGCADGCFFPSLSTYFNHVFGLDRFPPFIRVAEKLKEEMKLDNVDILCNDKMEISQIKSGLDREYDVLFCLEVMEHVGEKGQIYESKLKLLKEISNLISEEGIIVLSVPKMVGLSFLAQRFGLSILGQWAEPISFKNLINAGIFKNTDNLEENWDHLHLGFNHLKMEKTLQKDFRIIRKVDDFFQVIYVFKRI